MNSAIIKDLGSGLVLRRATAADLQSLADFNSRIHTDDALGNPDLRLAAWTSDLMSPSHPTTRPEHFTLVEEPASRRIVSSLCLIPQQWTYEGIEFGVGRIELVGTLPEFRQRGLIRAQMEVVHGLSAAGGHLVQAITGIENYYRQFGYEMALDLFGRRFGHEANVPKLAEGTTEPFILRPAVESDIPLIVELHARAGARSAIACLRTPEVLLYEMRDRSKDNPFHRTYWIIEDLQARRVGYIAYGETLGFNGLRAAAFELTPGISWLAVTPTVVRHLWERGGTLGGLQGKARSTFGFLLGTEHPVYEALGADLPTLIEPYAWYLRVSDVTEFLRHIRPVLERRLAASIAAGHSGTLHLTFFRSGVKLVIERGTLSAIEPWKPQPRYESGDARFPDLTFLQVLFGRRSFQELDRAYGDCNWTTHAAFVLVNALFPKRPSEVLPLA
jgi:hypothetical protein